MSVRPSDLRCKHCGAILRYWRRAGDIFLKDEAVIIAHLYEHHRWLIAPYVDGALCQLIQRLSAAEVFVDPRLMRGARPDAPTHFACFRRGYEYSQLHAREGAKLIHGVTYDGGPLPMDHAWVEMSSDVLFDPTTERFYQKPRYYELCQAVVDRVYGPKQAKRLARRSKHYGPWRPSTRARLLERALEQALTQLPSP